MKNLKMSRKAQVFDNLGAIAVGIAGLAITLVITFLIISQGRDSMSAAEKCAESTSTWNGTSGLCCSTGALTCEGANITSASTAMNSTRVLGSAVDEIPEWISLIVIAVIGSIILGLVALFKNRG